MANSDSRLADEDLSKFFPSDPGKFAKSDDFANSDSLLEEESLSKPESSACVYSIHGSGGYGRLRPHKSTRMAAKLHYESKTDTYARFGNENQHTFCNDQRETDGEIPQVRSLRTGFPEHLWDTEWGDNMSQNGRNLIQVAYTGFSALSLYCPIDIGDSRTHGLVDCGAGINMANTHYVRSVIAKLGGDDIEIINDSLTVRVAHGQKWHLKRKARITYKIKGEVFKQDFWLSEDLQDDILLGMPSLRNGRTTLNIGYTSKEDFIYLRERNVKVPLKHRFYGVRHSRLPLSATINRLLPAGKGMYLPVHLRGKHGIMWPKGTALTGLVAGADNGNYACLPKPGLHELDKEGGTLILSRTIQGTMF